MNKEEISLTGRFLYTNPRANLTQIPPIIRNKNDIETIKELQQINSKLQQENERLKEYMKNTYDTSQDLLSEMQKRINQALEVLGKYRHYCVPDEIANRLNEELVDKAYKILGGEENE